MKSHAQTIQTLLPHTPRRTHDPIAWDHLFSDYEWLARMEGVSQDPSNHGEIDLAIHVKAVAEALLTNPEWDQYSPETQDLLFWSALLHDVGKPDTRTIEEGKIRFPHHAPKGTYMAREILWKTFPTLPIHVREKICGTVRYHGLPLKFSEKSERDLIRASLVTDMQALAQFAKADVLGRICSDSDALLETIALFEMQCQELGCWDQKPRFSSPLARFLYFKEGKDRYYQPYDDTKGVVHLLSGLPGVGKDTYIQKYLKDYPVISLDQIRQELKIAPTDEQGLVIQEAKERSRQFMRKGTDFVWNATNITLSMRSALIDLFWQYRYLTHIHYVEVPYHQLFNQNSKRTAVVPSQVLERLIRKLEPPTLIEAAWVSVNGQPLEYDFQ